MSGLYPKAPVDVSRWLKTLPEDGSVPEMSGWRALHTPGHSPGHISLWCEADRLLVVGDAFVTTKAESVYAVTVQKPEVHGPPRYYTPDWPSAEASVKKLAELELETVVSGHGPALQGAGLRRDLQKLADHFDRLAVPAHGRYVGAPARADLRGTRYVPPKKGNANAAVVGAFAALVGGWFLYRGLKERRAVQNTGQNDLRGQNRDSRNEEGAQKPGAPEVERSLTVGRSAEELYNLWLEPDTLPKIMNHVAEVRSGAEGQTHWQMKLPLGRSLEWDTRVTEERRDERVHWVSLEGAALPNEGRVTFRPATGDRGTVVTLRLEFNPPGGALGSAVAKQFEAVPKNLVGKALRRFKSLAETGEMPTLSSNPSARGRGDNV